MANVFRNKTIRQYFIDESTDYSTSSGTIKDPCTTKNPRDFTIQNFTSPVTTNEDLRKQLELVTSQYLEIKERMDQMEQRERELIKKLMEMVSGPDDKAST